MKKHTLLSLLLLSFSLLTAQSNFQRHYGQPSGFDEVASLATTQDGGYLAAGTTANLGNGGLDMLLEKVDSEGNSVWQTTWGDVGNDGANHIISVSAGGFLVSGYTEGANQERDFAAVRFDEQGNELWRIIRGAEYNDEAIRAMEMPDGGLLIIGHTGISNITEEALLLIRTSPDGISLWEKTFSHPGIRTIIGCAPADNDDFFILLNLRDLVKFDGQGNEIWTRDIAEDFNGFVELYTFARTSDGQLRIGGQAQGMPFIAELNENGELISNMPLVSSIGYEGVNSFALTPSGKLWATLSPPFGNPAANATLLYLIDPATDEVLLTQTNLELGLMGLQNPISVYPAAVGEGFLFAGNTLSNAKGRNGLLYQGNEQAEETWRKTIGVEKIYGQESGRMVVEASDGGFLIAGNRPTLTEERNLWLIRTNVNGNVQWSADLGSPQNDFVAALAARADGSFVVSGYHSDTLIVSSFDDTGTPLWYREFSTKLADGTFGMTTNSANEILLTMPVYQEDGPPRGALIKLSAQGDSLWTKYYQPGAGINSTYGITVSSDGGYIICGCAEDEEYNYAPLLLKTDADGNELWSNIYESDGFFSCLITAYQGSDGDVFANGVNINSGTRPYILRASSAGNLIRAQRLELDPGENSYFTWFSGWQQNTGQQLLFGRKTYFATPESQAGGSGAITALSSDGDVVWERDYGRAIDGTFRGGTATSDGGIIAVGTGTFDNSEDAWLVKTQANGTVSLAAPLRPPFEVRLSPNPATDWLQVAISGLSEGEVTLTVFNLNGQQLHTKILLTTSAPIHYAIQVNSLAPGGYILHLEQGGKAMAVKWVKGHE